MPDPGAHSAADQLIEKITEFEHQLDVDKKTTIDEINEQLALLLEHTDKGSAELISKRAESVRAFREVEAKLQEFQIRMDLASMDAEDEFEAQKASVLGALLHLDHTLHQLETEQQQAGTSGFHGLRKQGRALAAKIESLHLQMNMGRDSVAKQHLGNGLAEIKASLAALPAELRDDAKHLGKTVSDISKDAFDALKVFFEYQENRGGKQDRPGGSGD